MIRTISLAVVLLGLCSSVLAAHPVEGEIAFEPAANEAKLPKFARLKAHRFAFKQQAMPTASKQLTMFEVTFPSPVVTEHVNNNTVHCEYFRPVDEGRYPAVVVLHILGGDFDLSRMFCRQLASNGVAALFLKMPYYGPRRQPGVEQRMIMGDPRQTVSGMQQAVLDIRRGAAWLAAQPEVDADQLGVFGISLGGITSALAATCEPRFQKVCLMLAGGDIGKIGWEAKELAPLRQRWLEMGETKRSFLKTMAVIDPVTYADQVRGRKILMLNATRDEVIPRACTDSLWKAFGEPEIVWMDAGHYSAMRFIFDGMARVTRFFQAGKN